MHLIILRFEQTPGATATLSERAHAMDMKGSQLIVATADRQLSVFMLSQSFTPALNVASPLSHQTRCVALFPDMTGFAVGSIEGRVAIHNFDPQQTAYGYLFYHYYLTIVFNVMYRQSTPVKISFLSAIARRKAMKRLCML